MLYFKNYSLFKNNKYFTKIFFNIVNERVFKILKFTYNDY